MRSRGGPPPRLKKISRLVARSNQLLWPTPQSRQVACLTIADAADQWHALIWLLWPTPQIVHDEDHVDSFAIYCSDAHADGDRAITFNVVSQKRKT